MNLKSILGNVHAVVSMHVALKGHSAATEITKQGKFNIPVDATMAFSQFSSPLRFPR